MSCLVERDYDNLVHILSFSKLREHPTVEATKKIEEATGGEKKYQVSGPRTPAQGIGTQSSPRESGLNLMVFCFEKPEKNVRKGRRS